MIFFFYLLFFLYGSFCCPSILIFLSVSRKVRFPYMMFRWAFYLVKWASIYGFLPRRDIDNSIPHPAMFVISVIPHPAMESYFNRSLVSSFLPRLFMTFMSIFFTCLFVFPELCLLFLLCGLGFFVPTRVQDQLP